MYVLPCQHLSFVGHWTGFHTPADSGIKYNFTVNITVTGGTFTGIGNNEHRKNKDAVGDAFTFVNGYITGSLFIKSS